MSFLRPRSSHRTRPASYGESDTTSPTSSRSGQTFRSHSTTPTTAPSICSLDSWDHRRHSRDSTCMFDVHDYFSQLREDVNVSDDCPSASNLAAAGDVPIFDMNGNSRPFRDILEGDGVIGQRQLVLFVRHFYCGACQAYLKALTASITTKTYFTMPIPTSIAIIGCGAPSMIPAYKQYTGCPFPVYADPTRSLYKELGMSWSVSFGKRPEYMKETGIPKWMAGQARQLGKATAQRGITKSLKCGNVLQIGGEFLFENGKVIWCHRMKNYRDHTEISSLRKVLEVEDD